MAISKSKRRLYAGLFAVTAGAAYGIQTGVITASFLLLAGKVLLGLAIVATPFILLLLCCKHFAANKVAGNNNQPSRAPSVHQPLMTATV